MKKIALVLLSTLFLGSVALAEDPAPAGDKAKEPTKTEMQQTDKAAASDQMVKKEHKKDMHKKKHHHKKHHCKDCCK